MLHQAYHPDPDLRPPPVQTANRIEAALFYARTAIPSFAVTTIAVLFRPRLAFTNIRSPKGTCSTLCRVPLMHPTVFLVLWWAISPLLPHPPHQPQPSSHSFAPVSAAFDTALALAQLGLFTFVVWAVLDLRTYHRFRRLFQVAALCAGITTPIFAVTEWINWYLVKTVAVSAERLFTTGHGIESHLWLAVAPLASACYGLALFGFGTRQVLSRKRSRFLILCSLSIASIILMTATFVWYSLPVAPQLAVHMRDTLRAANSELPTPPPPEDRYFTKGEHNARLYNLPPGSTSREQRIEAGLKSVAYKLRSWATARKQQQTDRSAASALQLITQGHHAEACRTLQSALRSIRRRGDPIDVILTNPWQRTLNDIHHMISDPSYIAPVRTDIF